MNVLLLNPVKTIVNNFSALAMTCGTLGCAAVFQI